MLRTIIERKDHTGVREDAAFLWEMQDPCAFQHYKQRRQMDPKRRQLEQKRLQRRMDAIVSFLQMQGALGKDVTALDIGSGALRLTNILAPFLRSVTALDCMELRLQQGLELATSHGITNVSTVCADFSTYEMDQIYDLVIASLTPAIQSVSGLKKMMKLSSHHCFASLFVETRNPVREEIQERYFTGGLSRDWYRNRAFALLELLWGWGFLPRVGYYREDTSELISFTDEAVRRMTQEICLSAEVTSEQCALVKKGLGEQLMAGVKVNAKQNTYLFVFWDVTERTTRHPL